MERRDFLKTAALAAAQLAVPEWLSAAQKQHRKPNFVFILVDDLGWTDVSCYGSKYYETPHIDRLAREGIRFTDAYATCALCSPTRASYMTGRYPARIGITDWIRARYQGGVIPADKKNPDGYESTENRKLLTPRNPLWMELEETTIAEALKIAGYSCCHIGKWHLGADDWYPDKQGFDYNIGGCDLGEPPSYFDPWCRAANKYWPEDAIYGIPTLKSHKENEYLTDREADEAVNFIRNHKDKPFYLSMCHYAVHFPIQAKAELVKKYEAKKPVDAQNVAKYAAMVESVDDAVGRIMDVLDELNLRDDTVVFFTSDNGGLLWKGVATSNAPLRSGKGTPYEGGIREPLIVRWPNVISPNTVSREPVTTVDFFPTILEIANVPLPKDRVIDGLSLIEHLKSSGTENLEREAIFWHYPHYRGNQPPYSIIRSGDYKLIKWYEGKTFELFNLKTDLSEKNDLAEKMPEKVRRLDMKLTAWLAQTGAKLPKNNPDFKPKQ